MGSFIITDPSGKKFKVTGPNKEGAMAAFKSRMAKQPPTPQVPPASPEDMPWSEVPMAALKASPSSAWNNASEFASGVKNMVLHPINTANAIQNLGAGGVGNALSMMGVSLPESERGNREMAAQFGKSLVEPYYPANFKKTLATDPIRPMLDAATVLSGGEAALARVGAKTAAKGVGLAAKLVNPMTYPLAGIKGAASLTLPTVAATTGSPIRHVLEAFRSGEARGVEGDIFRKHLRGKLDEAPIIAEAKGTLSKMRKGNQQEYEKGMSNIPDVQVDLQPVAQDFINSYRDLFQKGLPKVEQAAIDKMDTIWEHVKDTMQLKGGTTVRDADALRNRIDSLMPSPTEATRNQGRLIKNTRDAINDAITKQVPEYGKVMEKYSKGKDKTTDIEKVLSLRPTSTSSASITGLSSSAGTKPARVEDLIKAGTKTLKPALAGRDLASMQPHGGYLGQSWARFIPPRAAAEVLHGAGRVKGTVLGKDAAKRLLLLQATRPDIWNGAR